MKCHICTQQQKGQKSIAVRFSEYEDIALTKRFMNKLNWVKVDRSTKFLVKNINKMIIKNLKVL